MQYSKHIMQRQPWRLAHRMVACMLASVVLLSAMDVLAFAQMLDTSGSKPVRGQISISRDVAIAPGGDKVSLNMRDASLRDVLNILAEQGKFNLILDSSVDGTLTVDVKNISINKALEYIFTIANLSYTKDGNTVIVATKASADEKNLNAKTFKAIPVLYKTADSIATTLNNTIFKVARPGGSNTAIAASDPDSNSLLIMGSDSDIKLVADTLRELDVPRNRKVYQIQHNTPSYVAQVLAANFFTSATSTSNGSSSGSTTTGSTSSSTTGSSSSGTSTGSTSTSSTSGSSTGSSSSGSTSTSGSSSSTGSSGTTPTLGSFTAGGVTFISEPVSATLTVLGTEEQLALIDSILDQVDVRRPQVAVEVSLVEIQNSNLKSMVPNWSQFSLSHLATINLFNGGTPSNLFTFTNPFQKRSLQFATPQTPVQQVSVTSSNQNLRGKVLANPTVVTMDGASATITITDQVPTISQSNTIINNVQTITSTITTQDSGVTVTLTPQIFNDGAVVLNLQPSVSQPIRTVEVTNNGATTSTVLLATRSMTLNGVRVQDGNTLVIGGLLRETSQMDLRRVPGLDKLPIVSAMFRSLNQNNNDRTELVLMVTPHILKEDAMTYSKNSGSGRFKNPNQGAGGIQPVSLPKFIGPLNTSDLQVTPAPAQSPQQSSHANISKPVSAIYNAAHPTVVAPNASVAAMAKSLLSPSVETIPTLRLQKQDAWKLPARGGPDVRTPNSTPRRVTAGSGNRSAPLPSLDEILKN